MPWRLKREIMLILLGVGALVLGGVVLVANRDWQTDVLAGAAIVSGLAIVMSALPVNGNGKSG